MNNFCKTEKLIQPSFLQRLFRKEPKENAFIEVNNLFASKPLKEIKSAEIEAISVKYKVDLRKRFINRLKEIYRRYLQQSISDKINTDQQVIHQNYLKKLLMLNDSEVEEIHNQLAGEIYKKSYNEVISDGKIEKSEEEFLDKLKKNLRLPTITEETISDESTKQYMQTLVDKIVDDEKISPKEWEEFTAIAKNLDVDVNWNEKSKAKVEKFKLYWLIENGDLPIKEVSINLQKNEYCYFTSNADWLENRTVTNKINYKGPAARIKIMKGVYYRAGSISVQRITSEQLQIIDSGQVFLTNKQIIFIGNKKNSNIQLNKILSIKPFSDGIEIEKDSGESLIFQISNNADLFAMTLTRVINDFQIT